jgi:hypothetical protein
MQALLHTCHNYPTPPSYLDKYRSDTFVLPWSGPFLSYPSPPQSIAHCFLIPFQQLIDSTPTSILYHFSFSHSSTRSTSILIATSCSAALPFVGDNSLILCPRPIYFSPTVSEGPLKDQQGSCQSLVFNSRRLIVTHLLLVSWRRKAPNQHVGFFQNQAFAEGSKRA